MPRLLTSLAGDDGRLPVHPVRVLRIEAGEEATIQTLSPTMGGILTHFIKGRSEYCLGVKNCPPMAHAAKSFWKGYFACDVNTPNTSIWRAWVCELSEAAELDIRGYYCRGLVLRLWRRPASKRERPPLRVEILDLVEENTLRSEFDILPVLRTMYHVNEMKLDAKNPLPDRVALEERQSTNPSADKGPYVQPERQITPAEVRAKLAKVIQRPGKPKVADERSVG